MSNSIVLYLGTLTLFLGTVYSGAIDPHILQLLKAAEQRSHYYVVSPVHYLPVSSFLRSFPLYFPSSTTNTNLADNVDLTEDNSSKKSEDNFNPNTRTSVNEDTVSIESDDAEADSSLRLLSPPDKESKSDTTGIHKYKDEKKERSGESKPENTYLPPKKDSSEYLPPKEDREYLPLKPVYGPPPTTTEAPVQFLATYIVKSYYEPGFEFQIPGASGHLPLFQPVVGVPTFHNLAFQPQVPEVQQNTNSTSVEDEEKSKEKDN